MQDDERAAVQEGFAASERAIVVATIAFGMEIDKANIRNVYHYNVPKSLENLSQEIGRAGRDGLPSTCETFVCHGDLNALENFAYGDMPGPESVQGFVGDVFALREEFDVSLYDVSAAHHIRQLATPAEILAKFDGERREFLGRLLPQAEKARTWFHIDVDRAVGATGAPRARIVRALDYLHEQRLLEVKAEGVRSRFRRLKLPADLDAVADFAKALERASAGKRNDTSSAD